MELDMKVFEPKPPVMESFPATIEELAVAKMFTQIKFCLVRGEPNAHNAYLVIGNQSFCVTPQAAETVADASWTCWMLAKALINFRQSSESVRHL